MVDFYGKLVGQYTFRPMDAMGMVNRLIQWNRESSKSESLQKSKGEDKSLTAAPQKQPSIPIIAEPTARSARGEMVRKNLGCAARAAFEGLKCSASLILALIFFPFAMNMFVHSKLAFVAFFGEVSRITTWKTPGFAMRIGTPQKVTCCILGWFWQLVSVQGHCFQIWQFAKTRAPSS